MRPEKSLSVKLPNDNLTLPHRQPDLHGINNEYAVRDVGIAFSAALNRVSQRSKILNQMLSRLIYMLVAFSIFLVR